MGEYDRFCPVSMASEVIADRWTPLILRELVIGSTRFNDIARGLPGISRGLLVRRLSHLERMGVLEREPSRAGHGSEYHLTPAGRDLEGVIMALGRWSIRWLYEELQPSQIDPVTLTWWMHRRVDPASLPEERVVVQFDHTAPKRTSLWMVAEHGGVSVCQRHPGFDTDVLVTCTTGALAEVFSGTREWKDAVASGAIRVDGPPRLTRSLPSWFVWSPFAPDVREASQALRRAVSAAG